MSGETVKFWGISDTDRPIISALSGLRVRNSLGSVAYPFLRIARWLPSNKGKHHGLWLRVEYEIQPDRTTRIIWDPSPGKGVDYIGPWKKAESLSVDQLSALSTQLNAYTDKQISEESKIELDMLLGQVILLKLGI